jgi:hypothetical protein
VSFRDLIVRATPQRTKEPKPKAQKKASKWGTPEERYRRLCLLAQLCRYAYYVKHTSIIPDAVYDKLERVILRIEDKNRDIIDHRRSPTGKPGSDKAEGYPRTVLNLWDFCGDDPRTFAAMEAVIEGAIKHASEAFSVVVL